MNPGQPAKRKGWMIVLAVLLVAALFSPAQAAETPAKKVLILYSNSADLSIHALFTRGFATRMGQSAAGKIEYSYEYLDMTRNGFNKDYGASLSRFLQEKYAGNRPDLVVTHLEPAANFMKGYGEQTFPGVPAVLSLYTGENETYSELPANYRSVVGTYGTKTAISFILQAQPNTRKIYVVAGDSDRERNAVAAFRDSAAEFAGRTEFIYLNQLPFAQILETAKTISGDSVIFYLYFYRDVAGNDFIPGDALRQLHGVAQVPVYSSVDVFMGRGTVGGYMASQAVLGAKAAEVAEDILGGNMTAHGPLERAAAAEYIFDWRELKRWGIDESRLPAGSRIEFRQPGLWETYRWQIASGMLLTGSLLALIGLLLVIQHRRRQVQAALRELNVGLEQLVAERTAELQEINTSLEEEITERQAAERQIREQAQLLDYAHDYIMVRGLDSRVVYWNQGAEKGYGFTTAEAVGRVTHDLLQTKFPESLERTMESLFTAGHWEGELIHSRKDGVRITVQSHWTLNRDLAGTPVSITEINHDITEKKQDERQIREQAQLLDYAHDYIMVRDLDSRVVYWNQGAEKGYGFTAAEAVGRVTHDLLQTKFPESVEKAMDDIFAAGHWTGELIHCRKDGARITVQSHQTLYRDASGNPVSILEINHDISMEKEAQALIREANLRLQRFNAELEATVAERTAELQETNAAMEEEIMERQAAQEALATSNEELRERERLLRRMTDELTETNKELTSFANSIAHDFRSPMVNLKGFSHELGASITEVRQALQQAGAGLPEAERERISELLEKDVPEALGFIYTSVDRLDKMVNALLGLARLGRRELTFEDVDMEAVAISAVQAYKHEIDSKKIAVTVGKLPKVSTNRLAMEQILGNLVDNAVKYLRPQVPGQIRIEAAAAGDEYLVSVTDNGRGIANDDHEKIFQAFRRAGVQDAPGDGMGLAYVRTLVRQLGGRVWCESELGAGTAMYFTLPVSGTQTKWESSESNG
ncbi:MAG: PAS domain S-box protein [Negativicutes bacterium]|nr:PAS domain S-box protein [Negativicutes bacterium]